MIRQFEMEDSQWLSDLAAYHTHPVLSLPSTSWIYELHGKRVGIISLLLTNANFGIVENFMTIPELTKAERNAISTELMTYLKARAVEFDLFRVIGFVESDQLAQHYCRKFGAEPVGKHHLLTMGVD